MKILIINGPNINMLGLREPDIYGRQDYKSLIALISKACEEEGIQPEFFQSNHEGDIVDKIQSAYGVFDGIVNQIDYRFSIRHPIRKGKGKRLAVPAAYGHVRRQAVS